MARDFYVYLKLQSFKGSNLQVNTIPLRIVSVGVTVDKTIPDVGIPFSGIFTGEAQRLALDLGMSNKQLNLSGFITDMPITKKFGEGDAITRNFTAQEVAQMIASGVDSTAIAHFQAFQELVILIPSTVDKDYNQVAERFIPLTFHARGDSFAKDNRRVPFAAEFPDTESDEGLKGFVRNFNYTMSGETTEIEFSMDFQVATILP